MTHWSVFFQPDLMGRCIGGTTSHFNLSIDWDLCFSAGVPSGVGSVGSSLVCFNDEQRRLMWICLRFTYAAGWLFSAKFPSFCRWFGFAELPFFWLMSCDYDASTLLICKLRKIQILMLEYCQCSGAIPLSPCVSCPQDITCINMHEWYLHNTFYHPAKCPALCPDCILQIHDIKP